MNFYYKIILFVLLACFLWVVAHWIVYFVNIALRNYLGETTRPARLTGTLGLIERIIYTVLSLFGKTAFPFIAAFFGIKIAQRLISFTQITDDETLTRVGERANAYLICNILSLVLGVAEGLLLQYLWNLS